MASFLKAGFITTAYLVGSNNNKSYNDARRKGRMVKPSTDIVGLDVKKNDDWDVTAPIKDMAKGFIIDSLRGQGPEIIKQAFNNSDNEQSNSNDIRREDFAPESKQLKKSAVRRITREILNEAIETFVEKVGVNSKSLTAAVATAAFARAAVSGAMIVTRTGNFLPLAAALAGTYISSEVTRRLAKNHRENLQNSTYVERLEEQDNCEREI